MNKFFSVSVLALGALALAVGVSAKDYKLTSAKHWSGDQYQRPKFTLTDDAQIPKDGKVDGLGTSVKYTVKLDGTAFHWWALNPKIKTRGNCTKVTGWVMVSEGGFSWMNNFTDKRGKTEVKDEEGNKMKMEEGFGEIPGEWTQFEIVPEDLGWPQPCMYGRIAGHNWGNDKTATDLSLYLYNFTVSTEDKKAEE